MQNTEHTNKSRPIPPYPPVPYESTSMLTLASSSTAVSEPLGRCLAPPLGTSCAPELAAPFGPACRAAVGCCGCVGENAMFGGDTGERACASGEPDFERTSRTDRADGLKCPHFGQTYSVAGSVRCT